MLNTKWKQYLFSYDIKPPEFYKKNVKKRDIERVMGIVNDLMRKM